MSRFPGLSRAEFEAFLKAFTQPGTLIFRNNKWLGLNQNGKSYTVHVRHGGSRKYEVLKAKKSPTDSLLVDALS